MNEQVLRIDIGRIGLHRKIDAVQGDSGRVLKCILTDYAIPPDASARIYAIKPSGAEIYNNCDIVGNNSVVVELTTQMLAELGVTRCQVEISKLEKKATSFEFSIEVKKSLISDTAIESTDEFTALEEALAEARQVTAPVFDEASDRVNIQSGETIGTLFGKIKKWFTDLGAAAFYGVANNLTTTVTNMVLDARQGKALADSIDALNRNMGTKIYISSSNGITTTAKVTGNIVTVYLYGAATVELGTMGGYASCGTIPQLLPLFSDQSEAIKYAKINPLVNSQVRIDKTNGNILIGYTINNAGEAINFPAQYGVYATETFVL